MSFTLLINEVDRTDTVDNNSLLFKEVANDEVDTLDFSMELTSSEIATIKPTGGDIVKLKDGGVTIFTGIVQSINEVPLANKMFAERIRCDDLSSVFKARRVVDSFQDKDIVYVINTLLNTYANKTLKRVDAMESGWTNGQAAVDFYVDGDASILFSDETISKTVGLDLTQFNDGITSTTADFLDIWIRVDDITNLTSLKFKMGDSGLTNFFEHTFTGLVDGWNYVHILKSSLSITGSPDFAAIVDLEITAVGSTTIRADDWRMIPADSYTKNNINTDFINIEFAAWNYEPLNRSIKELADLVLYTWYIDPDKDIHFFPSGFEGAAFNVTDTNGNMTQNSLTINEDLQQIKNVIFVRGGEFVGSEDFVQREFGDGEKTSWRLDYRYQDLVVEVDTGAGFVTQTVGIINIDADDGSFQWFSNFTEKFLKQAEFGSPAKLSSTDEIRITYNPFLPVIVRIPDNVSIAANGEHEFLIIDRNIKSKEGAQQRGFAELAAYKDSLQDGGFITNVSGLRAGTLINIQDSRRGLNRDYLIWSISAKIRLVDTLQYTVKLISNQKITLVETLTRLLLKETKTLTIDDNEVLDKILSHAEDIVIDETHVETLTPFVQCKYGPSPNVGRYNFCTYGGAVDNLMLLETGDSILLETGDKIILN